MVPETSLPSRGNIFFQYLNQNRLYTARKIDMSTGPETPVSTGRAPGTAWSVLNVFAFSTGQNARY